MPELSWNIVIENCNGSRYENGRWRSEELASHRMEWLPEFALDHTQHQKINGAWISFSPPRN